MGWKEKMKEFGGADVGFLSEDGELISFVVVGEPVLIEGKYQKQDTKRIGVPCVTIEGFQLLIVGMRVGRRLSKHESVIYKQAFDLVRHGEPGDTHATYELTHCQDADLEKKLLEAAKAQDYDLEIIEAVEAAREIAAG